jgi:ABC-type branched-subunit amino acid transport system permease subunit
VVSGILIAPTLGLDSVVLTLLVVQAFGAAAIGRFTSLPLTYLGGVLIGVGAALAQKFVSGSAQPALLGLPASLPFLVLLVVLVFARAGSLAEIGTHVRTTVKDRAPLVPVRVHQGFAAFVLVTLVVLPHVVEARVSLYTSGLAMGIVFLSLGLLVNTSDQISLCHAAFVALGATSMSHFTVDFGLPWPVALLLAGLATVPIGAVVSIPAIRLSGVYLALATFGFGILMQRMIYPLGVMFGIEGSRRVPRPSFAGTSEVTFYYVALAVFLAAAALVVALERTRLGRLLRALADSPVALATHGTPVNTTRTLVFCVSAFVAGLGGAVLGATSTAVQTFAGFGPFDSLTWLAVLIVAGRSSVRAALVAGLLFSVAPAYTPSAFADYQPLIFGALAVGVTMMWGRTDLVAWIRRDLAANQHRRTSTPQRASAGYFSTRMPVPPSRWGVPR